MQLNFFFQKKYFIKDYQLHIKNFPNWVPEAKFFISVTGYDANNIKLGTYGSLDILGEIEKKF